MVNPDNTKIRVNFRNDNDYAGDEPEIKPVHEARPTKDFRKVMYKQRKDLPDEQLEAKRKKQPTKLFMPKKDVAEEETEEPQTQVVDSKDDVENATAGAPVSLFELSRNTSAPKKEPEGKVERAVSPEHEEEIRIDPRLVEKGDAKKAIAFKEGDEKKVTRYAQEQPDLSNVNPMAIAPPAHPFAIQAAAETEIKKTAPAGPQLAQLVAQLVKQLYVIESNGKTDTVLTLDYPPIFKDARIIVSSFDSAHGQFNIAFENLTQEAQLLLSRQENQKSLLNALEQKGYGVQMITVTTANDIVPLVVEEPQPRDERRQQQEEQPQKRRHQEQ